MRHFKIIILLISFIFTTSCDNDLHLIGLDFTIIVDSQTKFVEVIKSDLGKKFQLRDNHKGNQSDEEFIIGYRNPQDSLSRIYIFSLMPNPFKNIQKDLNRHENQLSFINLKEFNKSDWTTLSYDVEPETSYFNIDGKTLTYYLLKELEGSKKIDTTYIQENILLPTENSLLVILKSYRNKTQKEDIERIIKNIKKNS